MNRAQRRSKTFQQWGSPPPVKDFPLPGTVKRVRTRCTTCTSADLHWTTPDKLLGFIAVDQRVEMLAGARAMNAEEAWFCRQCAEWGLLTGWSSSF